MNSRFTSLLMCGLASLICGCDALVFLLPRTVTVRLVNNGSFPVDGELYYDDNQDTVDTLLREIGTLVEFDVDPGETYTFTRSCDDLQAIYIDDADLRVIVGVSPDDDTRVLRDGTDFSCGDTITYTFDHSELLLDFNISTSVTPTSVVLP